MPAKSVVFTGVEQFVEKWTPLWEHPWRKEDVGPLALLVQNVKDTWCLIALRVKLETADSPVLRELLVRLLAETFWNEKSPLFGAGVELIDSDPAVRQTFIDALECKPDNYSDLRYSRATAAFQVLKDRVRQDSDVYDAFVSRLEHGHDGWSLNYQAIAVVGPLAETDKRVKKALIDCLRWQGRSAALCHANAIDWLGDLRDDQMARDEVCSLVEREAERPYHCSLNTGIRDAVSVLEGVLEDHPDTVTRLSNCINRGPRELNRVIAFGIRAVAQNNPAARSGLIRLLQHDDPEHYVTGFEAVGNLVEAFGDVKAACVEGLRSPDKLAITVSRSRDNLAALAALEPAVFSLLIAARRQCYRSDLQQPYDEALRLLAKQPGMKEAVADVLLATA